MDMAPMAPWRQWRQVEWRQRLHGASIWRHPRKARETKLFCNILAGGSDGDVPPTWTRLARTSALYRALLALWRSASALWRSGTLVLHNMSLWEYNAYVIPAVGILPRAEPDGPLPPIEGTVQSEDSGNSVHPFNWRYNWCLSGKADSSVQSVAQSVSQPCGCIYSGTVPEWSYCIWLRGEHTMLWEHNMLRVQ